MPHTVQLPDGRSVDFPETMNDADINSAVKGIVGDAQPSATPVMDAVRQDDANKQPGALSQTGKKIKDAWDWMWHSDATQNLPGMKSESQKLTDIQDSTQEAQPSTDPYALNPRFLSPQTQDIIRRTLAGTERDLAAVSPGQGALYATGGLGAAGVKPAQAAMTALSPVFAAQTAMQTGQGVKKIAKGNVMGTSQETGGLSDLASAGSNIALMGAGKGQEGVDIARNALNGKALLRSSGDILDRNIFTAKKQIRDTEAKVGESVGQLTKSIEAGDVQDTQKTGRSINIADIWPKIQSIMEDFKTGGRDTSRFNLIQEAILKQGPSLSWKQLHDIQMELGSTWAKAPEGTRDAGALNALRETIANRLQQRSEEIGQGEQHEAYTTRWSTLKKYENDGILGKLLDSPTSEKFMDTIRNPRTEGDLTRTMDDLSQFGLPKDFVKNIIKQNQSLHNYVKIASGDPQVGIGGKFKAVGQAMKQHPVIGIPAVLTGATLGGAVGTPLGPMGHTVGATAGAVGALRLLNRVAAAREVARQGAPSLKGPMAATAHVQPVVSPQATKPINPNLLNEVTSALINQDVPKDEARIQARAAVAKHDNFNDAFNEAIRRPTQEVKAQGIQQAKTAQQPSGKFSFTSGQPVKNASGVYDYPIWQDGKRVGHARIAITPEGKADVGWIGPDDRKSGKSIDLGVSGTKQLMEQFKKEHPEVTGFSGKRLSGAHATDTGHGKQEIKAPKTEEENVKALNVRRALKIARKK